MHGYPHRKEKNREAYLVENQENFTLSGSRSS